MADSHPTRPTRARKSTGGVLPPEGKRRSWTIRFRAYGRRHHVTLGRPEDGWNRAKAEAELRHVLADVERGIWTPDAAPEPAEPAPAQTFHAFASHWLEEREPELGERTRVDYRWRLTTHLLPFFADPVHMPDPALTAIGIEDVDRYRRFKVAERDQLQADREAEQRKPEDERERLPRPLSDSSINKTIRLLATILEQAVEYGLIDRNPAQGRKRLLRERRPDRSFLEPAQTVALLDAAATLDARAREGDVGRRRPLLAVLALGGLRIGEALNLRWRDVSLASQRLTVVASKTDAGRRTVALSPLLLEALTEYRARAAVDPDDYVFATSTGRRDGESNVRRRIHTPAAELADERGDSDAGPIGHVKPHDLRRTFASLLLFANVDLRRVMAEIGHTDPKMTLAVYAQVVSIEPDRQLLEVLVGRGYRAPGEDTGADERTTAGIAGIG